MTRTSSSEAVAAARAHAAAGRWSEADAWARAALEADPRHAEAHYLRALAAQAAGEPATALALARQALACDPAAVDALELTSMLLMQLGRPAEAEADARRLLEIRPHAIAGWNNLGNALRSQGRYAEAESAYRQALALDPTNASIYSNLGATLQLIGRWADAEAAYRQALSLQPTSAAAFNNLGTILRLQGRWEEAEAAYRQALQLQPHLAEAANNLGNVLHLLDRSVEAEAAYRHALQLRPNYVRAASNLALALQSQGRLSEAEGAVRHALAIDPADAQAHANLGLILQLQGRIAEALRHFEQAAALRPAAPEFLSSLLACLHYAPGIAPEDLARRHREWDERHAAPLRERWRPFAHLRDPDGPLHLGLVSADLGRHPVGWFLAGILPYLDRSEVLVFVYSDRGRHDDVTAQLARAVYAWRDVRGWSNEHLAERIRDDGIQLLVDLAGHTSSHRLLLFALKPAPVQLTWLGYTGTTGLGAIDYLIADHFHVPEGSEGHYRERVLRLPDGYVCYQAPADAPPVGPLPARARGFVTFGSCNNPAKIGPDVVRRWARILRQVPGSRLRLQYRGLDDPRVAERFRQLFAAEGIDPSRLELSGWARHEELLAQYHSIDIALDPFPYSGGLTTCEALWMGVPVVTCPGATFASRHAFSHLSNAGVTETIATDEADYERRAVELARDWERLEQLRRELRPRMAQSPLCDGPRFARHLHRALREVWRQWCATSPVPDPQVLAEPASTSAEHLFHWACALHAQGRTPDAEAALREVLRQRPTLAEAANQLGYILLEQGRWAEAEGCFRQALGRRPTLAGAANNLGMALHRLGRFAESEQACRQALSVHPGLATAWYNLGNALLSQGRLREADEAYNQCLERDPKFAAAWNNRGLVQDLLGRPDEAERAFRHALTLAPQLIEARTNLGSVLDALGRLSEAAAAYRQVLALRPDAAEALNNLGDLMQRGGQIEEAGRLFRRACNLQPYHPVFGSNALLNLQYMPGVTPRRLAEAHIAWNERQAARLPRYDWTGRSRADRPRRLGFVSADFRRHPVGVFLAPVLECWRRWGCELIAYSDVSRPDLVTRRIARAVHVWRDIRGLADDMVAERIAADQIDLLFDLAGHTGGHRLLVFARRPARVQLTWIGYTGTTGLATMDYLIADRYHVPPGTERWYREHVLRLPDGYVVYEPPADAPDPGPLPALRRGFVTLGSFNNAAKFHPGVVALWADVLRRLPKSRLVWQHNGFGDPGVRQRFRQQFEAAGIDPARVDMHGWVPFTELLPRYQEVDLALDPFPYSGGLTTCEALWMGVPVVTCPGETFASRHSLSHLSNAGLPELVTSDLAGYARLVMDLASDWPRLAELRRSLRDRLRASPLCAVERFSRQLLDLLTTTWQQASTPL
ncbi:MAG: tetratricopeptide repeat protein [Gemmataceae bacterium]|nr:tetratricopeptide repeat protein [Gemmataceae bacterium]MDW8264099.1 tetratricopeptide repeat protein [Gemmataceae bacterium]